MQRQETDCLVRVIVSIKTMPNNIDTKCRTIK